ncbi:lycopene cyclase domain-containing protein [Corynebacterium sp. ES2794-CONJ1]|uniref:lycopene cyclase domain-containing protein n=1 Tax=unclassified Corynebacterium TaxID=2624378 RepID=UPI0021688A46|nr:MULTISPECIES: lycopene cyclase domain-containing protein [unclassified Corynebacterium]MCS4490566.1 lycopene cyclase domain-containing protein [Corynebacterium sp. ES2775-CONJ]MCS4492345.1 lycopene cyclase domain-containing protein [Corynebacterium sp. ES2715-CONJ3]MCS4532463.1 lycopene cyclase domain-containing protein [Corynebacterium sp. ES2730-CONJ]MCU9519858.1 lycopene cyclase domain-containing protein [Corynebacterium sp. ES2794-CONJ1]
MTGLVYLLILLGSLSAMVACDYRYRLAFFLNARHAGIIIALLVLIFLIWDGLGIITGTFFRGGSPYMTGILLAPELPLEEPIFLIFLSYLTINLTTAVRRLSRAQEVRQ